MVGLSNSKELLSDICGDIGLRFEYAWSSDDPLLDIFFDGYDKSFVIDSEKEDKQGFKDCLALNEGDPYKQLSEKYGPYREFILVAYNQQKEVVGGANFICLTLQDLPGRQPPLISINLNYVFILPEYRGKKYLRPILRACSELTISVLSPITGNQQPIVFFEQNDPVRMTVEDYEADSKLSGLDQIQRIAIWARVGAKIIDFPYVQPALSEDQEANHDLLLCVMGEEIETSLDPCLLKAHLERFFRISVLKNQTETTANQDAATQLNALDQRCVDLFSPIRLISGGKWADRNMSLGKGVIGSANSLLEVIYA